MIIRFILWLSRKWHGHLDEQGDYIKVRPEWGWIKKDGDYDR